MKWTHSQSQAIKERGKDLLVSASAGSGKTSVMIERIACMIENKEAAVSDLLVLTFTNASAADMKAKLKKRLCKNLDESWVGTFHKFCSELIRTYFNIAGISPDFEILDEVNAGIIKSEILDSVITKNYDKLHFVIDTFCVNRKTDGLKNILTEVYNFLATREDAEQWLEKQALASYDTDIAMQTILEHYRSTGQYFLKKFDNYIPSEKEKICLNECKNFSKQIAEIKEYDDLHKLALTANFTRLKPGTDEEFKALREKFKAVIQKIKDHYGLTYAEILKNQKHDREIVAGLIELVKEFDREYASAKQDKLDFNDLEKYACTVLNNAEVSAAVRQKYKYIFIDEYQDTNPMQEKIMSRVGVARNTFMVGDVKQSIYGFRGCEAAIFSGKMSGYEKNNSGQVVKLNENFRSQSNILNFVNQVFGKIMKDNTADIDYDKTSKFNIDKTNSGSVEVLLLNSKSKNTADQQGAIIADKILNLIKQGTKPSDIAILARSRNHFNELALALHRAGISAVVDSDNRASELFEIALLNNMLFAVSNFYNDVPLVMLMSSFVFGFTPEELAQIKLSGKETCFYKLLLNNKSEKVISFLAFLDKYRELSKTHNVADLITVFLTEYKIINKLLILPNGRVMADNIHSFLETIRGASYAATISGYLYLLENDLLEIKIKPSADSFDSVQIMTMHASKGLEFPIVFVFDTGAAFNTSDTRQLIVIDKNCGLCVYSLDASEFIKTHSLARLSAIITRSRTMIAEEMRLLYVALTRAKQRLIIIGGGNIDCMNGDHEDYDIACAKNYLQLLAPTVLASVRDNCFSVEIINAEEINITYEKQETKILTGEYDKGLVKNLKEIYSKPYPYKTDVTLKSSVSALTNTEQKLHVNIAKAQSYVGKEFGTKVHKQMQGMEIAELEALIPLIKGYKIYRELPFLQGTDENIIQGVIDLLAVKENHAIIIDYKTNNTSEQNLTKQYSAQLGHYANAVTQALGINTEKYIYSTVHKKLVKV